MSHFTKVKTKIHDRECLKKALDDLHFQYEEGNLKVRGFAGRTEQAEIAVNTSSPYDIGFRLQDGAYEMVADWWGVEHSTSIKQQAFTDQVTQRYSYHKTVDELHARGFQVTEEIKQNNVIELTVHW